ncbi:glycoside hydrolase family 2 protein [Bacteroidales bacterium OttesenSCG-928-K22]|nr:glycoside hydrolase family 2 protein [Bacteroidales bacterium OttesenSCG-928-L14]MDL2240222.1 glycoside hydrolase family 2 protein [Bacteroidales bacterium OttesenSCG-928-K22]
MNQLTRKSPTTFLFILSTLLFFSCDNYSSNNNPSKEKFSFNEGWTFIYNNENLPANVPGFIHLDLMDNNIIEDPFYRDNEQKVQWVAERNWIYQKTFNKTDIPDFDNVQLVFEGLDTYANIYINDELIKSEDSEFSVFNMFREWRYNFPDNLKDNDNVLKIEFFPPQEIDKKKAAKFDYKLPEERAFTRKAPYQSGWDWGPVLITSGIWKPVYLEAWNNFKINTFQVYTETLTADKAKLKLIADFQSDTIGIVDINIFVNDEKLSSKKENVSIGNNVIELYADIDNPKLWWPNGLGEQNLYDVKIKIENSENYDIAEQRIGLRTIELITDKDEIGSKFEFHVNGIPVFMKGANYIPSESFPVNRDKEYHRRLIEDCKNANFNMLRIWGGGIYEDDEFYELCDELGILIWQDFIFSCALYPGDKDFLNNVEVEAKEQVLRIRNHPCIALWCGNNEVKNGWEDWGWKNEYFPEQHQEISAAYDAVFHEILPMTVEKYDPQTAYHASSPLWGWGHDECCTEGDSHYWGVWWGEQDFEIWKEKTGRFMSEYGFQSYPDFNSVKKYTKEEDWNITSPVMRNHQKHGRGIEIITNYMDKYFGVPEKFEDYLYVSQLLQAYGVGEALKAHRISSPHCMGTLYWQINDCWPVASWSSIDYYGNKKALYYTAKNIFEKIIIVGEIKSDTLNVYLVSDMLEDVSGQLSIKAFLFNENPGNVQKVNGITAKKNTSTLVYQYPKLYIFTESIGKNLCFLLNFVSDDGSIDVNEIIYFDYFKNLIFPKANIDFTVQKTNDEYTISIKNDVLAVGVYISASVEGNFSDNYFTLIPNSEKTVIFTPEKNVEPIFKIKSYSDAF